MTIKTGKPYYFNCVECGKELWTEGDRRVGICLKCLAKRIATALQNNQPIQFPWSNARNN